jgi:alkylation response protein AidB-like acyl-CoA dehydrogenase
MNLGDSPVHEAFRREARAFVADACPAPGNEAARAEFWRQALARGYLHRGIPRRYGGSEQPPDPLRDRILDQELGRAGAGAPPCDARGTMIAHTLLDHGSEAQCRRFLPPTLAGALRWCQGYSEPNAGSDLAALRATGRFEGDTVVLNGQKIWTSGAHRAHWMFGLFRTEPDAPKHAGISYLLVEMSTPGIRVAPMRQIDGGMDFDEVFFDEVRVPAENLVGARGAGWAVSRSTLKYERGIIGGAGMMQRRFAELVELARRRGRLGDPSVRQRLAEIESRILCADLSGLRVVSAEAAGSPAGVLPLILMTKLYATVTLDLVAKLALELIDADALGTPTTADAEFAGDPETASYWLHQTFIALNVAIGGGTSNIQRNIIGEQVLGLPRDPRPGSNGSRRRSQSPG